jgi:peptide/nickel transport system permease protein
MGVINNSSDIHKEQVINELSLRAPRSWIADVFSEAIRSKVVIIGFVLVMVIVLLSIFAPLITPHDPEEIIGANRLSSPSLEYPFGTDHLGRDILSRVFFGVRTSLIVSLSSIILGMVLGSMLGLISGYLGGKVDNIMSRILDVFFGIPTLLLAIALSAALGTGILNPIVAIAVINIPFFARLVRGPTLSEKTKQYVQAARAIGADTSRIIFRYIFPNIVPIVIVQGTVSLSYAILIEASLGFVGLGVQPPTPSLGNMLNEGRTFLELAPWFSIFPGLAIMLMIMAFNLAGDGLRDALDPMMRGTR